jgi:hypothetical protein
VLSLRNAGIDFTAVDMPNANRMTVGVMALVAEQEREAISKRNKDALAAAKARGVKLGNPRPETARFRRSRSCGRGRCEGCGGGAAVGRDLAGLSANAAAQELNRRGVQTPRGGSWTARSVLNRRPSRASGRPSGHLAPGAPQS